MMYVKLYLNTLPSTTDFHFHEGRHTNKIYKVLNNYKKNNLTLALSPPPPNKIVKKLHRNVDKMAYLGAVHFKIGNHILKRGNRGYFKW